MTPNELPQVVARELFQNMMNAPYGNDTVGNVVCAETTRNRLESAWLPIITETISTLTAQGGDAVAGRVNGYLHNARAVEVVLNGPVPEWITSRCGAYVLLSPPNTTPPAPIAQGGDEDIRIRKMRDGGWQVRFGRGAIPEVYKTALEAARVVVQELEKDEPAAQGGEDDDCGTCDGTGREGGDGSPMPCNDCAGTGRTTPPAPISSAVEEASEQAAFEAWARPIFNDERREGFVRVHGRPANRLGLTWEYNSNAVQSAWSAWVERAALASTAASGGDDSDSNWIAMHERTVSEYMRQDAAAPAMPDGWVSVKRDYYNEGRDPIPTVTFTFKPDDWQSRDRFARAFTVTAASAQGDGDGCR